MAAMEGVQRLEFHVGIIRAMRQNVAQGVRDAPD